MGNDRLALIETGTVNTVPHVLKVIDNLGLTPEHLDYVIPTHVHLDHAAGAGAMLSHCPNARLVVHPRGAPHMISPEKIEAGTRAVYGDEKYERLYGTLIPVAPDKVIEAPDNATVDLDSRTLTFLDTPGHARHHFCVHDDGSNSLFTGDTAGVSYRHFDGKSSDNKSSDEAPTGEVFWFVTTTPVQFEEGQGAAIQINRGIVGCFDHFVGGNRNQGAVETLVFFIAIDGAGTGFDFFRVDHVWGTAWMNNQTGVRAVAEHGTRSGGVIEVNVGGNHVIQVLRCQAQVVYDLQNVWHGIDGAGLDQCQSVVPH